jgi:hypothetical protein
VRKSLVSPIVARTYSVAGFPTAEWIAYGIRLIDFLGDDMGGLERTRVP